MKSLLVISLLFLPLVHAKNMDLLSDTQIAHELHANGRKIEVKNGTIYLEKNGLSQSNLKMMKEEFEEAIQVVPDLLGIPMERERYKGSKPVLYIYHSTNVGPHIYMGYQHKIADSPAIFIPSPVIKEGYAPVFHEVAHLITENFWSLSLREGLADFVQFYFRPGQKATMKKSVVDFHSHARSILENESAVFKFIGREGHQFNTSQDRIDFYQLSRSFVTFLIHEYGGAKFLDIYNQENAYEKVYARSLKKLKEEWLVALKNPVTAQDFPHNPFKKPRFYYWWREIKQSYYSSLLTFKEIFY